MLSEKRIVSLFTIKIKIQTTATKPWAQNLMVNHHRPSKEQSSSVICILLNITSRGCRTPQWQTEDFNIIRGKTRRFQLWCIVLNFVFNLITGNIRRFQLWCVALNFVFNLIRGKKYFSYGAWSLIFNFFFYTNTLFLISLQFSRLFLQFMCCPNCKIKVLHTNKF